MNDLRLKKPFAPDLKHLLIAAAILLLLGISVWLIDYYGHEHNHQGIGNQRLIPDNQVNRTVGEVACRERLGGLLRYFYRKAA